MQIKLFVLLCALTVVLAQQGDKPMLVGGGGGSLRDGVGVSIDGRAPVWTSDNGRHSVDVTGGYSQHLGGPYGSSRPDFRGGGVYTYRF